MDGSPAAARESSHGAPPSCVHAPGGLCSPSHQEREFISPLPALGWPRDGGRKDASSPGLADASHLLESADST